MTLLARIALLVLAVGASEPPEKGWLCNIPVFRYALERWPVSTYDVVVFHQGPLEGEARAAVDALRAGGANVEADHVNLERDLSPRLKKIWDAQSGTTLPWMIAIFPGTEVVAWSGPASRAGVSELLDSPARRHITHRLLEGDSAVWVLLESGDPAKDEAAAALLGEHLRGLEQSLKIPARAPDDPPLLTGLPLRIAFSILRLSRKDPLDGTFVEMLRRSDPKVQGPAVFAVFGRGRLLPPIWASDLTGPSLDLAGEFVAGPCACEVKELNPGLDLLLSVDWEQELSVGHPEAGTPVPTPVIAPGRAEAPPETYGVGPSPAGRRTSGLLLWVALGVAGILVLRTGARVLRRL